MPNDVTARHYQERAGRMNTRKSRSEKRSLRSATQGGPIDLLLIPQVGSTSLTGKIKDANLFFDSTAETYLRSVETIST